MDLEAIDAFEFEPRMSDADALMWSIEKDPLLRSTIVTVFILDRTPDRERLVRTMERVTRRIPRLRQRVLGHPLSIAPPRWEIDANFDLNYHLRWVRAVGEGTVREVFEIAEPIAMQGFDRARPLWEFTVVEGLADGKAALIGKVHHSITDGVGGMKLQMEMLDLERDPVDDVGELPPVPEARRLTEKQRWIDAMTHEAQRQVSAARGAVGSAPKGLAGILRDPVGALTSAIDTATSVVRTLTPAPVPMSPLMTNRSLSVHFETLQLPLGPMKQVGRLVSGKLNDAFIAGVAGGLRRYHDQHGYDVGLLRMSMPISIRDASSASKAGNQFVPARFPVPIDIDDPISRMNAIRELVAQQRAEPALSLTDPIANLVNRLPASATVNVLGPILRGIDFVTSNVPGAPVPLFLGGARIESQIPLGPMAGAATNVTLLSYCDDINIGINTDPAAVEDPALFAETLRDSFDEILKLV